MRPYYVLDGQRPVPVDDARAVEWARWWADAAHRRVASDHVGPAHVSTVFLGVDYGFGPGHRPVLFETMIFAEGIGALDEWQRRYCTWADAEAGHARAVAVVRRFLRRWGEPR